MQGAADAPALLHRELGSRLAHLLVFCRAGRPRCPSLIQLPLAFRRALLLSGLIAFLGALLLGRTALLYDALTFRCSPLFFGAGLLCRSGATLLCALRG